MPSAGHGEKIINNKMKDILLAFQEIRFFRAFFFLSFLMASAGCVAQSQNSVAGKVRDSSTGLPIPFASVFLATTTIGTITAEDGSFKLTNIPRGKYSLTVSSVGYKMMKAELLVPGTAQDWDIEMEVEIKVLKDVVVKTSQAEYLQNVRIFKEYFLGSTKNAEQCTIVNMDDIDLDNDLEGHFFIASCSKPIIIENYALGYRIFYTLEKFHIDLDKHSRSYEGVVRFEQLYHGDNQNEEKLERERQRAYYGSLNHFMRSLYKGTLHSNKFDLYIWRQKVNWKTGKVTSRAYSWYPLSVYDFREIRFDSLLRLKIEYGGIHFQVSHFTYLQHGLILEENGYYDDPMQFFVSESMSFRSCIADLLPLDYSPRITPEEKRKMADIDYSDSMRWVMKKEAGIR
jgi:hypothetical protein